MTVHSTNEWGPLKEVIIGTATHANFPATDKLFQIQMSQAGWDETPPPSGPVSQKIIDETNADLDKLARVLHNRGVKVYRPDPVNFQFIDGQYAYCPRDNLLVVGDTVIEAPMSTKSRQAEMTCFRDVKRQAINTGANWLAAPVPDLMTHENVDYEGRYELTNKEPIFDAANIARFGNDLLYLISSSGNECGAKWLQRALGDEYTVHTTDVYNSSHIDSTIVPIDSDCIVLNANRVNDDNLPEFLKDYTKIYITDDMIDPQGFEGYPYASKWIAINMLSIGNKTVICDANQPLIHAELEKHGFKVIPLELRHSRTLGGGFHCVTLDLLRE